MTKRLTVSRYLRNEEGQRWEKVVNEPWEGREFLLCMAINFQRRLASSSARKSGSSMVAGLSFLRMSWVPGSFYLLLSPPEELPTSSCLKLTVHDQIFMVVLLEGEPLPGLETGLMSNTQNELFKDTRELTKQETLLERGARADSRSIRAPRRTALPRPRRLGFYGDGISFWVFSGPSLTRSPSWWCTHCSAKIDASEKDSGRLVGHMASPLDLSQTRLVGGSLLVPCSFLGSPVVK